MPPFASPGQPVRLHPDGFVFEPGATYVVSFKAAGSTWQKVAQTAIWSHLDVKLPVGIRPGPTTIVVNGPGVSHTYPSGLFTTLPPAPLVPAHQESLEINQFETAVTEDGTLLVPFDLSYVLDPTQFAFQITNLPYEFEVGDVTFYNVHGFDLTLFTLSVSDGTQRQWGSYYGWQVQDDTGLLGDVYDHKVRRSAHPDRESDVLTYWRHEFHTYAAAHAPGGTHQVDANGLHPDGTFHVDHENLIVAISGRKRSTSGSEIGPLKPGFIQMDLALVMLPSESPVEPEVMLDRLAAF
jgi:hypothetical protein